jgi:hypothetical protein
MPLPLLLAPLGALIAKGAALAAPVIAKVGALAAKGAALGAKALGAGKALASSIIKPASQLGSSLLKSPIGKALSTASKLYTAGEAIGTVVDTVKSAQQPQEEEPVPDLVEQG